MVPVYCVTTDPKGPRALRTIEEFRPYGINPIIVRGFDNKKWNLKPLTEMHHNEGFPYFIDWRATGCYLSHWMTWNHLILSKVPYAMIVEDDIKLCGNFTNEFEAGYAELPSDWGYGLVGHCCAGGKPANVITPRISDIRWPMCTHCYIVKLDALEKMIEPMAECRSPIDIAIFENVFSRGIVKCYTFTPRLAVQYDTFLHD
ncbi:MAG TPA: glycosyltransferase family 25 protein [Candidatus Saccharimonadia bacterium]|nr:glycosyltransferase family 25 protein [Candidatus Saccharimonadia bacterium]